MWFCRKVCQLEVEFLIYQLNKRMMISFSGAQFPKEVILFAALLNKSEMRQV
jgi:hypothetical protein